MDSFPRESATCAANGRARPRRKNFLQVTADTKGDPLAFRCNRRAMRPATAARTLSAKEVADGLPGPRAAAICPPADVQLGSGPGSPLHRNEPRLVGPRGAGLFLELNLSGCF